MCVEGEKLYFMTSPRFPFTYLNQIIMKYYNLIACIAALTVMPICAQDFSIPVLEDDEPMATGKFEPTWESLSTRMVPQCKVRYLGTLGATMRRRLR